MKKNIILSLILIISSFLLVGCGSKKPEQIALRDQGIFMMEAGDYEGALKNFNKALSLCPGRITDLEIDICYYKAAAYNALDMKEEAIDVYTSIINYNDKKFEPFFYRGSVYASMGELGDAVEDYDMAVSRNKNDYDLYISIYQNLYALHFQDYANEYLDMALDLGGKSDEDYFYRGRMYFLLQDYDNAVIELGAAVSKGYPEAKVFLANVYRAMGDDANASALLEDYISSDVATPEALGTMGDIELASANYESALSYYNAGLGFENPDNMGQLLRGKAICLEYLHQFTEARNSLAEYLKLYPEDEDARREMIFLATR